MYFMASVSIALILWNYKVLAATKEPISVTDYLAFQLDGYV